PTPTNTPTVTDTPIYTYTPTNTPTITPTPSTFLVGHVTWQGRPAQPNALQSLPITLTLRPSGGGGATQYTGLTTDSSGFFTVTVDGLSGSYNWRVKSAQPDPTPAANNPGWLAVTGTVSLPGTGTTQQEMGLQLAGDANNDNVVSASDFTLLKSTFGKSKGQS